MCCSHTMSSSLSTNMIVMPTIWRKELVIRGQQSHIMLCMVRCHYKNSWSVLWQCKLHYKNSWSVLWQNKLHYKNSWNVLWQSKLQEWKFLEIFDTRPSSSFLKTIPTQHYFLHNYKYNLKSLSTIHNYSIGRFWICFFQKTFEKQEMKSFRGAITLTRAKTICNHYFILIFLVSKFVLVL